MRHNTFCLAMYGILLVMTACAPQPSLTPKPTLPPPTSTLDAMLANAEAVVREYMAASEALDLERTLTLYSESIIWEDPGYGDGEGDYFTSKAEVKAMYGWFFALPDIHLDNTTYFISADGHRAAVEWVWTGTHNADTYTIRGVSVLEIEDGKIVHEVIYYDPTMAP